MSADGRACRSVQAPRYDRERRELRVGAVLVKRFTQRSDAQEIILQAFQEENWQAIIDDPLPGKQGQDPKRRLATAVANLNRRQRAALLYFGVTRLGTGVEWRFREASDREATGKRQ